MNLLPAWRKAARQPQLLGRVGRERRAGDNRLAMSAQQTKPLTVAEPPEQFNRDQVIIRLTTFTRPTNWVKLRSTLCAE